MKTAAEITQHLQEIIANIYLHPGMYGETVAGVEQALWIYHRMWAYVTERDSEWLGAQADASDSAGSGVGSFGHFYRKSHRNARGHDVLLFVLKHWTTIATRLGIPMPAEYPDPQHSFLPSTAR